MRQFEGTKRELWRAKRNDDPATEIVWEKRLKDVMLALSGILFDLKVSFAVLCHTRELKINVRSMTWL